LAKGINSESSLLDVFVRDANTLGSDNYYTSLASQAQLLVTDTTTGEFYAFNSPWPKNRKIQRYELEGKGSMGDVSFALAANYANKLYIGASFNISVLDYRQTSYYSEEETEDTVPEFKNFTVKEYFRTRGSGISGKFGIIYRPVDFFRIGVSIHTPTFYTLTDNFTTDVTANYDNGVMGQGLSALGVYKYRYSNPFRVQLSTGFVLGKFALIGLEYEYVGYNGPRFKETSGSVNSFQDVNDRIRTNYKGGHIIKAGGELKLEPFSLRAGLNYATNPYQNYVNNSPTWGVSAGAGYRSVSTGFFIDAAYTLFVTEETTWMYDPALVSGMYNQLRKHNILLTAGFNF
jgi:long-subunit fatty acid transport protein